MLGVTNAPVDLLLKKLQEIGLTPTDIHHLEYLDDRKILEQLPGGFRWLSRNNREHVILYFNTYAEVLEAELLETIQIPTPFDKLRVTPVSRTPQPVTI